MSAPLKIEDFSFENLNTPEFMEKYQKEIVEPNKILMDKTKINWNRMNIKYFATQSRTTRKR